MRDANDQCGSAERPISERAGTPADLLADLEAFLVGPLASPDRGRCADLARAVSDWITDRRADPSPNDGETGDSCFSHMQRRRERENDRLEIAAADEIAATFRSLAVGRSLLEPGVLRNMVAGFAGRLRSRDGRRAAFDGGGALPGRDGALADTHPSAPTPIT